MINAIINGIFYVVQTLIAVVLAPIDLLLADTPVWSVATNIVQFRTWLSSNLLYFLGNGGFINTAMKAALVGMITRILFFYNAQRAVSLIKLAYNWLQKIKFW